MTLPSCRSSQRQPRGFTLIEVMIVVAIIGILAAIGYPSYRDYVIRGGLVDATNGLTAMRADMEKHFQDNRTYQSVPPFTSPCLRAVAARTFGEFVVTCSAGPTATTYTLSATANAGTAVAGFVLTVDQADVRGTAAAPTGWQTCATRWLTKKGAACV